VHINVDYNEQTWQTNFRGVFVQMKAQAILTGVGLSPGTTCDTVKIFNSNGELISEGAVTNGFASVSPVRLYYGQAYSIVAGDTHGACIMSWHDSPVDYSTTYLNFSKAQNGMDMQDGPTIAIQHLELDVEQAPPLENPSMASEGVMSVEANVIGDMVEFEIPESIYLGDIARGFATNPVRVNVSNAGNTDIALTTQEIDGDDIFSNVYLSKRVSGEDKNFRRVPEFDMSLSRPSTLGGKKDDYFYIKLDLSDYHGVIPAGTNKLGAELKFIAVAL
jgi:hypothetical protein